MKTLFGKLLISFGFIVILIIVSVLAIFYFVYSKSYEEQIIAENSREALYMARSLHSFINAAYKEVEDLSFNNDIVSLDTARQTDVLVSALKRNDYFELLYAQGMDGMQTGRSSGNLGNRKERWWFIKMEQVRKPFISESYYSVGTNMPCASVFYPITLGTEMIGIMAGDIKLSALHDLVAETADAGSFSFILDGKGVVVAHPDSTYQDELYNYAKLTRTVTLKDAQGSPMQNAAGNLTEEQPLEISDAYKAAITDMMNGNINSAKFREASKTIYLSYRPVIMEGASDPWYVLSVKDGDYAMRTRNTVILAILGSSFLIILAALVIVFFVARNISSPIKAVYSVLEKVKEGDLTAKATVRSQDEIGQMMRLLNQTQEGIRELVIAIKDKTSALSEIGNDLASNMNVTASAINQITANVQSIKVRINSQSAYVSQTHGTMEQLVDNIHKLDAHVGSQSSNVSQASSAIEEMVANTRSVTNTLIKNAANVNTLRDASEVGRSGLSEVAQDINEISHESEGLMEINLVMQNIASQTNLLSMNAAIEAAHAGETGKGFAVVANEIRKLAESSSKQSKTINNVLKKIKGSIDKITRSTENVLGKFEAIDSSVKTVAEQEENIRNAMEEQGAGSRQVLEGVGNVNEITRQVTSDSGDMLERAKEVITESENLEKTTQEISSGMNEMASGAEEINMAVNHVKEISGKNREAIDVLLKEVSRFKVE
ncbi:MAG: methyl-accepting chemotaxis protein [Treponema sp.]|jgi:methyl-accepting chemotaxis protein|nr:methyl-accepting chemotaxis protein [Treponema sp.]